MSSEDISEDFGESHHCKNLKFKKFYLVLFGQRKGDLLEILATELELSKAFF
jgi:hypothetical protein